MSEEDLREFLGLSPQPLTDPIMDKLKEFADAQREIAFKQIGSEMMFKSKVKRVPFTRI